MVDHWAADVRRAAEADPDLPKAQARDLARLCDIVEALPSHEFRSPELAALADALSDCSDMDALAEVLLEAGALCGFQHANIFLLRHGSAITFEKRVCTSFPREWLRVYDGKRYQFVDPVIARALSGGEPFVFSDLGSRSPLIAAFWADAVEKGIGREGCCFTYDLDLGVHIGMSFNSTASAEAVAEAFARHRSDLNVFGEMACNLFVEHAAVFQVERSQLSIDDLRFLKGLISATDADGAAALLQGADTQELQRSICQRLGVATIFQALSIVSRECWFDELPFDGHEVAKPYPGPLERDPPARQRKPRDEPTEELDALWGTTRRDVVSPKVA